MYHEAIFKTLLKIALKEKNKTVKPCSKLIFVCLFEGWNPCKAIEQPILDQLKLGAYNNFGGLLYEAENYETALSIFEKTVEIDPSYADGYYNLGLVLKQLHRLPESIKAYKKALKLNPDNPAIYQNLGVAYLAFGSYNEAIKIWQKGLQLLKDQGNVSRAEMLQETLKALGASWLKDEQSLLNHLLNQGGLMMK